MFGCFQFVSLFSSLFLLLSAAAILLITIPAHCSLRTCELCFMCYKTNNIFPKSVHLLWQGHCKRMLPRQHSSDTSAHTQTHTRTQWTGILLPCFLFFSVFGRHLPLWKHLSCSTKRDIPFRDIITFRNAPQIKEKKKLVIQRVQRICVFVCQRNFWQSLSFSPLLKTAN